MISVETQMDGALLEVELSEQITAQDYDTVLIPAVEKALETHDRIRLMMTFGQEFQGYDLSAAWADSKLGLSHWSGFDRIAVVTDTGWLRNSIRLAAPILPCPMQVFDLIDAETARRWLRESLGSVHMIDLGGPCLQVKLMGKLDPEVIANAEKDLDAQIRARDGFRLLLDLSEFDGWQGLSAMVAHFSLVREHAATPERVAVVGDHAWQRAAQHLMGRFLNADSHFFDVSDIEGAKAWLKA
ncbi:STAS/SEC14 domain-containing protein [Ruegeria sp. 2012CJ41-6]|uniref:STAS/SEC14 domain-containing protein n=1 Tax=Ruegeria spongiae TaxID=2942209 RepID=A0ABT0Q4K6_9RHOB|nr:STAS/SEC14 domain-containing protein [Ruegeria spongiae]MCL6284801.1 STAS/SEC14 domain-containing protein [Ruegeria spongiae]